jgi:3-phenylpropionate/trans-cinnamate dioxygenase ferredoxin subunit
MEARVAEIGRIKIAEVPEGKAFRMDGGPDGICLVKLGDAFHALTDRCSHADVALSEGDVDPEEGTVECWKHGSTFSLLDGCPQSLPATRPVAVYAVAVEGDEVVVSEP